MASSIEHNGNRAKGTFRICNKYGIHARPAALIVKTAYGFDSEILVEKDGNSVSGRSIMGLMSLEAGCGSVVNITASGEDSKEALKQLENLIVERKFDED